MLISISRTNQPPRPAPPRKGPPRKGVVLLVVIAMLALFASVGLSFVYYAQAEAAATGISTQAQARRHAGPDTDPELLLAYFLSQYIFDVDDEIESEDLDGDGILDPGEDVNGNGRLDLYPTQTNIGSSLRGHALNRGAYGQNPHALNVTPFNGVPRLAQNDQDLGEPINHMLNHRYFGDFKNFNPASGVRVLRDPGRVTNRLHAVDPSLPLINRPYTDPYIGENVPWTYADLENVFLAQVNGEGEIVAQSYWRPWTVGTTGLPALTMDEVNNALDFNKIWGNTPIPGVSNKLKYMTLRPLPCYNPGFPKPADGGGDVRNGDSFKGVKKPGGGYWNNDSIWIDLGFPVRVAPDGRRYKPLFAPLIIDLDGKVNLHAHGNVRGNNGGALFHASNQGIGPWEVNLSKVLDQHPTEWQQVLALRYGQDGKPGKLGAVPAGATNPGWYWGAGGAFRGPPFWAWGDLDAVKSDLSPAEKYWLPGQASNPYPNLGAKSPYPNFNPSFPLLTYARGSDDERQHHPALYNYYRPGHIWPSSEWGDDTAADDQRFSLHQLDALYRAGGTGSHAFLADLFKLAPTNFQNAKQRNLVTLHSADLARPGITPWLHRDPNNPPPPYALQQNAAYPFANPVPVTPGASPNSGEFGPDYRGRSERMSATRLMLQRPIWDPTLNLNNGGYRRLTPYPAEDANGRIDTADATLPIAITDRQQFAKQLFERLRFVTTGARPPMPPAFPGDALPNPTTQQTEYDACRWLAQLAVNMVDYLDIDEYMTAFSWDPNVPAEYVFGTELPRLSLNEVYAEIANAPVDLNGPTATTNYKVNFWVELLNPQLIDLLPPGNPNITRLQVDNGWPCYHVTIAAGIDPTLRQPGNTTGKPDPNLVKLEVTDFKPDPADATDPFNAQKHLIVKAVDHDALGFAAKNGQNEGFYLMAPKAPITWPTAQNPTEQMPTPTLKVNEMPPVTAPPQAGNPPASALTYEVDRTADPRTTAETAHTVLLRRLANPALPPQTDPTMPNYNPYVTVDYMEHVIVNDAARFNSTAERTQGTLPGEWRNHPDRVACGKQQPFAAQAVWDANAVPPTYSQQSQIQKQEPTSGTNWVQQPQHSFFEHNRSNLDAQPTVVFEWLAHLDRHAISPIELLHVSTCHPHELTQRFMYFDGAQLHKHAHRGPAANGVPGIQGVPETWTQANARIYRLLEYLDSGYRMAGFRDPPFPASIPAPQPGKITLDGQAPGKININTIWDIEVFKALCDAQMQPNGSSNFDEAMVLNIFGKMLQSRSPGYQANGTVSGNDNPFRGLATPHTGAGPSDGLEGTLLRIDPTAPNQRLFEVVPVPPAQDHPVIRTELLSKIFNNVTTRSNVFAVWLTVGFFEVNTEDKNGNGTLDAGEDINANGLLDNDLLGAEIGKSDNRHVRHRMFAIVDRSAMIMPRDLTALTSAAAMGNQTVQVATTRVSLPSPYKVEVTLRAGMQVEIIDPNNPATTELITLTAVQHAVAPLPATITANFQNAYPLGSIIRVPADVAIPSPLNGAVHGNPGPQRRFDHRHNTELVPYYSIIQ